MSIEAKVDDVLAKALPLNVIRKCYWERGALIVPYVPGVCDYERIMDILDASGQFRTFPEIITEIDQGI
jgi:hypothetical protein